MSESVSRFQAEITAVMEVLLKVAVVEITKVFEGRVLHSRGCTVDNEVRIKEDLVTVRDIRTHMESALSSISDKMVCSIGVQVEEEASPQKHDQNVSAESSLPGSGESLPPSESLCKEPSEVVDIPRPVFREKATGTEKEDGSLGESTTTDFSKQERIPENGPQELCVFEELSSCSVEEQDTYPFSSVLTSYHSGDVSLSGSWNLNPVEKLDFPQSVESSSELTHRSEISADGAIKKPSQSKKVHFQLNQKAFDCKLLRPCSVELVNLMTFSHSLKKGRTFFSTHRDLRTHQRAHTGRRLCCFKQCGDGVWRLHGVVAHGHSLSCKICDKTFKRRKILKRHERFHTGEKPYSCRKCKKTFALRKSLRRHERFHTGERPHVCSLCRKAFRLKNNLHTHMRFHTGEKPFTCRVCSKGFRILKNLNEHMVTHSRAVSFRFLQ